MSNDIFVDGINEEITTEKNEISLESLSEHVDELEKKVKNLASFTRIQCDINNVLRFLIRKKYSENELNEALKEYEEHEKHLKNDENEEKK